MKSYNMHRLMGARPIALQGSNIIDAIERNFGAITREAEIGNAAGYKLLSVVSMYRPNILGGCGGVEITIESIGQPLCHNQSTQPHTVKHIWIHAVPDDLPAPHVHALENH